MDETEEHVCEGCSTHPSHWKTTAQAKKLDALGYTFQKLVLLCQQSVTKEDFIAVLKEKGIRSKPLREKLVKALGHSC